MASRRLPQAHLQRLMKVLGKTYPYVSHREHCTGVTSTWSVTARHRGIDFEGVGRTIDEATDVMADKILTYPAFSKDVAKLDVPHNVAEEAALGNGLVETIIGIDRFLGLDEVRRPSNKRKLTSKAMHAFLADLMSDEFFQGTWRRALGSKMLEHGVLEMNTPTPPPRKPRAKAARKV